MSASVAHRRAAKANRRKKLLAERRKRETAGAKESLAARTDRLAQLPLDACFVQDGLFEHGTGMLLLTRRIGLGRLALSAFLLDVHCLGVKDAFFREVDESEKEVYLIAMSAAAPFVPADPCYARKLLRDLVAYARSLGLEPHANYAACERLFGAHSADACDAEFSFGVDGRPLYVPGPSETPMQIRLRLQRLRRQLGPEGFDFIVAAGDEADEIEREEPIDALGASRG